MIQVNQRRVELERQGRSLSLGSLERAAKWSEAVAAATILDSLVLSKVVIGG
jgi:hypothetical protein